MRVGHYTRVKTRLCLTFGRTYTLVADTPPQEKGFSSSTGKGQREAARPTGHRQ